MTVQAICVESASSPPPFHLSRRSPEMLLFHFGTRWLYRILGESVLFWPLFHLQPATGVWKWRADGQGLLVVPLLDFRERHAKNSSLTHLLILPFRYATLWFPLSAPISHCASMQMGSWFGEVGSRGGGEEEVALVTFSWQLFSKGVIRIYFQLSTRISRLQYS